MNFSNPLHQGHSLSSNLKSTFLLFSFSLFCFFAPASLNATTASSVKCVDSESYFTKVETKKRYAFDNLKHLLSTNNLAQDTASSNETKLVFLTGFSPDIDSELQTFTILGVEDYPENSLSIFDKWGHEVFSTEGYNNNWNGTVDGEMMELGTYYYIFTDGKGKTYSGYVNIETNI